MPCGKTDGKAYEQEVHIAHGEEQHNSRTGRLKGNEVTK